MIGLGSIVRYFGYTLSYVCFLTMGALMQVAKWCYSLAIRLLATVVEALALKGGDDIEVHIAGERVF